MHRIATPGGEVAPMAPRTTAPHVRARRSLLVAALLGVLGTGCSSSSTEILAPGTGGDTTTAPAGADPLALNIASGQDQEGVVGTALPEALSVLVVDSMGRPLAGVPVIWTFHEGRRRNDPHAQSVTAHTDPLGVSSVDWELGTRAGFQFATAEVVLPQPVSGPLTAPKRPHKWKETFRSNGRASGPAAVRIAPSTALLALDETVQLDAQVVDRYGNPTAGDPITWTSSAGGVATVSSSGLVRAISVGDATVTAHSGSLTQDASISVWNDEPVLESAIPASVSISAPTTTLSLGQSVSLSAVVYDSAGAEIPDASVTWTSSNTAVASVGVNGIVTGIDAGSAAVTATTETVQASVTVDVQAPTASAPETVADLHAASSSDSHVSLGWTAVSDGAGAGAGYVMRVGSPGISWGTDYIAQVTIPAQPVGTAMEWHWEGLDAGETYEFQLVAYRGSLGGGAEFGSLSNKALGATAGAATTPGGVAGVRISPRISTLDLGSSLSLSAAAYDGSGSELDGLTPTWSSSNTNVLSVSAQGVAVGRNEGTATVTAEVQGYTETMTVSVVAGGGSSAPSTWAFTNVPSGLALHDRNNFTQLRPSGWDLRFNQSNRSPEIVSTTTPVDGTALRQWWSGVSDSWSPHYAKIDFPQTNEAFFGVIYRISPDWDWGTGNGWSKWFTVLSGAGNAWWGSAGPGGVGRSATQRLQTQAPDFADQWQSGTQVVRAFRQPAVRNGDWMKLEMYINIRPGEYRVMAWVNDELVLDGVPNWSSPPAIHQLKLGSTLGGGSGLPTLDSRYWAEYALVETYLR